uniref:Uncharacterized protein n=1 Tax=Candidatus Kentrum sp. UNK TaxID=2126344 RepID=A0A451AQF0_9GAMM|nr:MAG: hypothetical protein BECKUNK1418G_GA0071005_100219 [Candidatus Kentron sp. UNK]VFK68260.1 MAG: hypothetical protein BECKUNK1418H_GA0071006_100119 [Candidatus Kentron sp. UNK]
MSNILNCYTIESAFFALGVIFIVLAITNPTIVVHYLFQYIPGDTHRYGRLLLFLFGVLALCIPARTFMPIPKEIQNPDYSHTSASHELKLIEGELSTKYNPIQMGDSVKYGNKVFAEFKIKNTTNRKLQLETFVGARSPDYPKCPPGKKTREGECNRDFDHKPQEILPHESIPITGNISVDVEGKWSFWPSCRINGKFCDNEWGGKLSVSVKKQECSK